MVSRYRGIHTRHLSPKDSHVAKPLRELLTKLQEDRRNGKKKGRAKFTPIGPAAPDHAWAPFWNQEAETAFQSLKQMAANAVELQVLISKVHG